MILVGALGAQLVDLDGLGLADAVDARHGLDVRLRVPVAVVQDHRVRSEEVDPQPAWGWGGARGVRTGAHGREGRARREHRALRMLYAFPAHPRASTA